MADGKAGGEYAGQTRAQINSAAGKGASGEGCGKGSNQGGDKNAKSAVMKEKQKQHKCGNCCQMWGSAAARPSHRPCRALKGSGGCASDCPECTTA